MIDVDRETAVILERFGFDEPLFEVAPRSGRKPASCRRSRI